MLNEFLDQAVADITGEYLPIEDLVSLKLPLSRSLLKHKRRLLKPTPEMWLSFPETEPEITLATESMTADVLLYGVTENIANDLRHITLYPPVLAKVILQAMKPLTETDIVPILNEYIETLIPQHVSIIQWIGQYILKHNLSKAYGTLAVTAARYHLDTLFQRLLKRKLTFTPQDLIYAGDYLNTMAEFAALTIPDPAYIEELCSDPHSPKLVEVLFKDPRMRIPTYRNYLFELFVRGCDRVEYFEILNAFYSSQELQELIMVHLKPRYEVGLIELSRTIGPKISKPNWKKLITAATRARMYKVAAAFKIAMNT